MRDQSTSTVTQNLARGVSLPKVERQSTSIKKEMFLEAYKAARGIVSKACQYAGVHRDTYYDWVKSDPQFKSEAEDTLRDLNGIVEDKLLELAMGGHAPSIRYYLSHRHPSYMRKTTVVHKHQPIKTIEDLLNENQNS